MTPAAEHYLKLLEELQLMDGESPELDALLDKLDAAWDVLTEKEITFVNAHLLEKKA